MKDQFKRTINYMRISLTKDCNYSCTFCKNNDIQQEKSLTIKGTMQNYMIVLREDPLLKGSLRFNLLNQRIDIVLNSTLFNSYLYSFSQIKYERHNKKYE